MAEIDACGLDEIDEEDLLRFDHGGHSYAIYRITGDEVYCTDGLCTHEQVHLEDGLVMEHVIECPRHNGRFDIRTGKALGAPVCIDLATYPARVVNGRVLVDLP
ncbi:MAG: dioxygenase ferredoxin subunit [Rhodobacteraceae bacterium HLUCCA08]|nr:MAG: dioxygenase ferredoxin subunit [Rhodobacteraceae bacterium HLUCCA08]